MKKAYCALLLSLLAAGLAPLAASPFPKGEVFRVDTAAGCRERTPEVAALPGGGFVAVWVGRGNPLDADATAIYARVFEAGGHPLGPEIQVSQSGRLLVSPAVAAEAGGRFLVAWYDARERVVARLFEPSGVPAGPEQILATGRGGFIAVASLRLGGFAVAWADFGMALQQVASDGTPVGGAVEVESYAGFTGVNPFAVTPSIAVQGDGDLVLVWTVQNTGPLPFSRLAGKIIPASAINEAGRDRWTDLQIEPPGHRWLAGSTAGVDGLDNIVIAWQEDSSPGGSPRGIQVWRLDPLGRPAGAPFWADGGSWTRMDPPRIAVADSGDFVLVWPGVYGSGPAGTAPTSVYGRSFNREGQAASGPVEIAPQAGHGRSNPAVAWPPGGAGGEAFVVWQEGEAGLPQGCFTEGIGARRLLAGCVPGEGRLCLGDGRFQLLAAFATPRNGAGAGHGASVTRDTGYFWFFDPSNIELMVKVLDGRTINGKFWVFYGSLSNVAWTLKVTDLLTGAGKTYQNPANQLASRGDTGALPGGPSGEAAVALPAMPERAAAPVESALGPCTVFLPILPPPARPGLCLNDQRFEVEVTWRDPFNGGSGAGQGVNVTDDSGYFWFFDPSNVELVVKVLDGRAVNGKFWVFYGALTNVEYDIKVRQLDTGAEKTYHNPPFQFRSVADTAAFPTSGN